MLLGDRHISLGEKKMIDQRHKKIINPQIMYCCSMGVSIEHEILLGIVHTGFLNRRFVGFSRNSGDGRRWPRGRLRDS